MKSSGDRFLCRALPTDLVLSSIFVRVGCNVSLQGVALKLVEWEHSCPFLTEVLVLSLVVLVLCVKYGTIGPIFSVKG